MASFTPHVITQRTRLAVAALVLLAIAFLCQIVALATPGWLCTQDVYAGLFMYCGSLTVMSKTPSLDDCKPIQSMDTPDSLQAVRVMVVISVALIVLSFINCCAHLWMVVRYEKICHRLIVACVIMAIAAVILTLVTGILFGTRTRYKMPSDTPFGYTLFYSFAIFVVGGVFALSGAGLAVASEKTLTRLLLV